MIEDKQSQNSSNTEKTSQDNLPSWTKFNLKEFRERITYSAGVIMNHYLVVFVNDNNFPPYQSSLLAFNLRDHTVQARSISIGSFLDQREYSFLNYGENQIIKYGGDSDWSLACITIECFEPLEVFYEEIEDENRGRFSWHTAQIFQDDLYIYGQVEGDDPNQPPQNEFWNFNLKNRAWRLCETTGQAPELYNASRSFIFQNNFYVYGAIKENCPLTELFMLDLYSLDWRKIKQQVGYLNCRDPKNHCLKVGGTIYKDHLIVLESGLGIEKNAVCFLNLQTKNTWSTFHMKSMKKTEKIADRKAHNLMIYKNLLLSLAEIDKKLFVTTQSLIRFGISAPKSAEEEHSSSLFLSETDSDIAFKIQDKIIYAHRKLLVRKSQFFANLFDSGMSESRQDIIEMTDCEYEIFKEFLRFIYQGRVILENEDQEMKLYVLADKYLQADLCGECVDSLSQNINKNNMERIHDFAHQRNIFELKIWCIKFLKDYINIHNVVELIEYLNSQEDQDFKEKNQGFRAFAFNFILDNYFDIYENKNGNMQIYNDFCIKNTETDTLTLLVRFLSQSEKLPNYSLEDHGRSFYGSQFEKVEKKGTTPKSKELFEERTLPLREAAFSFMKDTIIPNEISESFSINFKRDFSQYLAEKAPKKTQHSMKINQDEDC